VSGSTGIWLGDPSAPVAIQAQGLDAVEASTGEVLGAVAGSAWAGSIGPRVAGWIGRQFGAPGATLTAQEANDKYGIPGVLTFDRPVSEATATALREGRQTEQQRQAIIARRPDSLATSGAARTAVAFATAVLDPVNVAAAFVPVVGQARTAALLAGASGAMGRAGVRAGVGAVEGAAGMAMLEPLEYALSRAERNDRGMNDTLAALAFGTVLGGGLHVLGGAAADAVRRGPSPVERAIRDAAPATREAALRGAVAAVAEGRPVEVAPLINLPTATSYRRVAEQAAEGSYAAFTPGGLRVEARPEVVDLSALIPSHMADGSVNPLYPHAEGLQPRDRSTAGSQDQIQTIAANLQPERLMPGPEAGSGAPIIDPRGVVESGNGRIAALQRVYESPELAHRAQAYRAFLEAQGYDLEGIANPVLVGRRTSELSPEQSAAFAKGANERPNLAMGAAEQARADADRAGRAIPDLMPGQLTSSQNRDFTRGFLAQLPAEERGALVLADGTLSPAGEQRMRQAILAHAYGDAFGPLLERMLTGQAEGVKGIAGALADSAGGWGRMRAGVRSGEISQDLDITAALGEAVQLIERGRREGKSVAELLAQADAFATPPGPATMALLRLMHHDDAMARAIGRERLGELLAKYTDEAMQVRPGPDLFGTPPAGPADLLRHAVRSDNPAAATARALDDLAAAPRARPEDVAASKEVARMAEAPIAAPRAAAAGEISPELAALTAETDDLVRQLETLPLGADEQATLARLRDATASADSEARATAQAALCMVGVR
jgi:hypothetical protein